MAGDTAPRDGGEKERHAWQRVDGPNAEDRMQELVRLWSQLGPEGRNFVWVSVNGMESPQLPLSIR